MTNIDTLPLVSILIPTYQGEEFIAQTLESAITQTYPNLEIIVSDDNSTDKTIEIVESFREKCPCSLRILTHERLGMVANWNFCISQAQGKYVKFLLQDDLLAPNCIEEMVKVAEQDEEIGLVFSPRDIILSGELDALKYCLDISAGCRDLHKNWTKISPIQSGKILLEDPNFFKDPINKIGEPSTVLLRKSVFEQLGYFDPELKQIVDFEMWTRVMSQYKIGFVNQTLSQFRLHSRQQSIQNNRDKQGNLDNFRFYRKLLLDSSYDNFPKSVKNKLYEKLEEYREILEEDRDDLKQQRDRALFRIKQMEKNEANLESELQKAQADFFRVQSQIEAMETSKFWKMRNAWLKIKGKINNTGNFIMDLPSKVFKLKQLTKKFIFSLSEDGLSATLLKTQRKILKKVTKMLTGKDIFQPDIEVLQEAQLEKPKVIAIQTSENPKVSIIIPVYNKFLYTFNCLNSLGKNVKQSLEFEIIVVDDNSTDETEKNLNMVSGIRVVRNEENLGFIRSCNHGASQAKGKYLYFLNNDTQILSDCIETLVETIEKDPSVGAVGSKLIYPNGRLQEAGGIIWQDASGWNYGRLDNPDEPEYNYVRPVDYCSGASLLVRAEIFRQLGGFSETFLPAYYEDTDLCFAIRKLGYKVIYQPKSRVIHYEGITSGTSVTSGVKQYQEINCTKFRQKWQEELAQHFANDAEKVPQAARRNQQKPTILVIDSYVPLYDRESGCVRMMAILKIFQNLGYSIIFLPDNGYPEEPYTSTLQSLGIEVLYGTPKQSNLEEQLIKRLPLVDLVWLCRPELCQKYLDVIRHYSKVPVIYDTIDLHFLRLKRQQDFLPETYQNTTWSWETYQKQETQFAKATEATVVVTDTEKNTLNLLGIDNVWVIPNIHHSYRGNIPAFEQRSDLVFIGSYNHPPNIDAVIWLCERIMPIVWESHPEIKVILLGSNMKDEVKALKSERVIVTGYVEDVEPYFLKSRVFVAPLRFGAGMKGKIGHSMSYGLPTVTTSIGAEGMGLTDGYDVMIADETKSFARKIIELYENSELWYHLSENSSKTLEKYSPEQVQNQISALLSSLINTALTPPNP